MTIKNVSISLSFFVLIALAFHVYRSKAVHPSCTILTNATYLDVKSGKLIGSSKIEIQAEKIYAIAKMEDKLPSENCHVVDMTGLFVLPGLIDSHTHLFSTDGQKVNSWQFALQSSAERFVATRKFLGRKNAESMLHHGFTTLRDLGNSGHFLDSELYEDLARETGATPRFIFSGPGLAIAPSQIDLKRNLKEYTIVDERTNLDDLIRKYSKHGVTWVKLYADNSSKNSIMNEVMSKRIVTAVRENSRMKIAFHAEYRESVENALELNADSIEHFYETPSTYEKKSTTLSRYVVITDLAKDACTLFRDASYCQEIIPTRNLRISWLFQNGFNLVFGADAVLDFSTGYRSRGEASKASLTSLTEAGLSNLDIIRSATSNAGAMLDLAVGEILPNTFADLIAVKENPLVDINALKKIEFVMANGKIFCQTAKECTP